MKKTIIYNLLATLIMLVACHPLANEYSIKGENLSELNGATCVLLIDSSYSGAQIIDTIRIENGSFSIKGKATHPLHMEIRSTNTYDSKTFFVDRGEFTLAGTDGRLSTATVKTSSPLQKQYAQLTAFEDSINGLIDESYKNISQLEKTDTVALKEIRTRIKDLNSDIQLKKENFIRENSANPVSAYLLFKSAVPDDIESLKRSISLTDKNLQKHPYIQYMQERINVLETVEIGKTAPDFTIADMDGNMVHLKDYRGKYLLIDFWASWCIPCRKEFPYLREVYQKYNGYNFEILGISLDVEKKNLLTAIKEERLLWKNISEFTYDAGVANLYGIYYIPKNFLINPQGKIIAKNLHGDEILKVLELECKKTGS